MKKTLLAATICLAFNLTSTAYASLTLTFTDSTAASAISGACSGIGWTAGAELRFCGISGALLGGGAPLQKNAIVGGETWVFNNAGQMTSVTGTPGNPGTDPYVSGSAAPTAGTNPSLLQAAPEYGASFYFLAPTLGSLAGSAYGPGMYMGGIPTNGTYSSFLNFNVLEGQWAGLYYTLGSDSVAPGAPGGNDGAGISFITSVTGASTTGNTTTFTFEMFANEYVNPSEDPYAAGAPEGTVQLHLTGTGVYTAPVPVPAAIWLFGSGVLGLAGFARRKKTV